MKKQFLLFSRCENEPEEVWISQTGVNDAIQNEALCESHKMWISQTGVNDAIQNEALLSLKGDNFHVGDSIVDWYSFISVLSCFFQNLVIATQFNEFISQIKFN